MSFHFKFISFHNMCTAFKTSANKFYPILKLSKPGTLLKELIDREVPLALGV